MKQVLIMRKDLGMSIGKLMAQCNHASITFLTSMIRRKAVPIYSGIDYERKHPMFYDCNLRFETELFEDWIDGSFAKIVCQAKNKNQLLKAKTIAEELGLVEGEDFFLIKDNCLTELTPEEFDENGIGRCLTCIGFKPLDDETAAKISRKFHLYMD